MTSELTKAHAAFIKQCGTIEKDGDAQFGKHATLQGVLGVINPALAANGLSVLQLFDHTTEGKTILKTVLRHVSGEEITSSALFPATSGRNPLHDWGSNTTYMRRFCLLAILGIAPGIEDNDGDHLTTPEPLISKPVSATTTQSHKLLTEHPPLSKLDREGILQKLMALHEKNPEAFLSLENSYRKEFAKGPGQIQPTEKFSDHIQETKHSAFISQWLEAFGK